MNETMLREVAKEAAISLETWGISIIVMGAALIAFFIVGAIISSTKAVDYQRHSDEYKQYAKEGIRRIFLAIVSVAVILFGVHKLSKASIARQCPHLYVQKYMGNEQLAVQDRAAQYLQDIAASLREAQEEEEIQQAKLEHRP